MGGPAGQLACARDLAELDLLVVVTSALRSGRVDRARLAQLGASGRPGARILGRVLALAEPRCESAYEVLMLRLHQVLAIEVEPQREVLADDGTLLARGDLWLVGTRRLHEYDGADHLVRSRQRKDLRRDARLGSHRWERRAYTAPDLLHQSVRILREADEAIGRPHDPSRVRAWHALLAASLFTPAGTTDLLGRLGLGPGTSGAQGA